MRRDRENEKYNCILNCPHNALYLALLGGGGNWILIHAFTVCEPFEFKTNVGNVGKYTCRKYIVVRIKNNS